MRMTGSGGWMVDAAEMNSTGANMGLENPYPADPGFTGDDTDGAYPHFGSPTRPGTGCMLDGIQTDCNFAMAQLNSGAAEQCLNNNCGRRTRIDPATGTPMLVFFHVSLMATVDFCDRALFIWGEVSMSLLGVILIVNRMLLNSIMPATCRRTHRRAFTSSVANLYSGLVTRLWGKLYQMKL